MIESVRLAYSLLDTGSVFGVSYTPEQYGFFRVSSACDSRWVMNSKYASVLIPLLLVGTLCLDAVTPMGYAVWVGYVFAVLLSLWIDWRGAPYLLAALGTVLIQLGFVLSVPGTPHDLAAFNRVAGITLLWITAALVGRSRRTKLDEATRRLGAIVESSSDAILSVTPEGVITSWNAGAERIFGYAADEAIGHSIQILIPADQHHEKAWLRASLHGAPSVHAYDAVRLTKDGRCIDVSVTLSPIKDAAGRVIGVSKIIRDVSDRQRAQVLLRQSHEALETKVQERTAELSAANYSLRKLSSRLMQVQEEERSRLARDLHDEIGQLLTALKIDLQFIQHAEARLQEARPLSDSLELVDQLLTQVRTLALDLRPSILDDLGLVSALRWYANRQAERNSWILSFSAEGITGRIPVSIEVACFRVVQEALTNVAKYAKAKHVQLKLWRHAQDVVLLIDDDGVGFDVMLARQRAEGGHTIGLLGMEERVRLAGGTLSVTSSPGHGTKLHLCFRLVEPDRIEEDREEKVMAS